MNILTFLVHHFYGYLQTDLEYISIPTGACGNVASGVLASKMGLPVKFIACVNENDIIDRCLRTGIFEASKTVIQTTSPV
jgi:threonine synthase